MMGSMYQGAGLISFIYPISIFGYALLEENRPGHAYWSFMRTYTLVVLTIKFSFNLTLFDTYTKDPSFRRWLGLLRVGLEKKNTSFTDIILYLLPEMLIISFIMLNQIQLKLLGLYDQFEEDFESIKDGIQRYMHQGDIEKVKEDKKQRTYMDMA